MIIRCLYDKLVPIEELKPHPQNPNRHSTEQVERLAKILNYQGWRYPIKVSKRSGFITSGHGRLEAARVNSWPEVPVNYQDYESFDQEFADIVSDNSVALWAELDLSSIQNDLKDLPNLDIDLLGIKDFSLAALMPPPEVESDDDNQNDSEGNESPEIDPDVADEIPDHIEPRVKPGESYSIGDHRVINGDCLKVLKTLPDNSVDSLVTDPPYGLSQEPDIGEVMGHWINGTKYTHTSAGFMGKSWDSFVPGPEYWRECLRVMKPGAHALVFAGTRTQDLMSIALRFAGFEMRDTLMWIHGQGFPKSHDISKAIDKLAGAEREVIGYDITKSRPNKEGFAKVTSSIKTKGNDGHKDNGATLTAPSTDAAKKYAGFGSALKPAYEPIIMVRKPLEKDLSLAENTLRWGCGGINIAASRIAGKLEGDPNRFSKAYSMGEGHEGWKRPSHETYTPPIVRSEGRFPANLLLSHSEGCVEVGTKKVGSGKGSDYNFEDSNNDNPTRLTNNIKSGVHYGTETVAAYDCVPECAVFMLDQQSGTLKSGQPGVMRLGVNTGEAYGKESRAPGTPMTGFGDSGGASRFFYCSKPSKREKNLGCEDSCQYILNDGISEDIIKEIESYVN